MKLHVMRVLAVLLFALVSASPAVSGTGLRHGLELQGGLGRYTLDPDVRARADSRWVPTFGAGWFVESRAFSGIRLGTGMSYRRTADEIRGSFDFLGTTYATKNIIRFDQLVLPLRAEWSVPRFERVGIEAGGQLEYVLKGMGRQEGDTYPAARPARPTATIFENLSGEHEVTSDLRRLGGGLSAGATVRGRLLSRDAALAVRYEHGLSGLWRDDFAKRYERLVAASLRMAW